MRNIFDQYDQPENKLTHALVSTLNNDRQLLRPFFRWAGIRTVPPLGGLRIVEQQVPGADVSGDEAEAKGLPDACIYDNDGWTVLIESKVQAGINVAQLRRHIATAKRHDCTNPQLILLSVDRPKERLPDNTLAREWREVYQWFGQRAATSTWAATFVDYMQVFESRMTARDYGIRGTLTMFDGFRFDADNPYTYREGKRLIRLLGDELQQRKDLHAIGVDPKGKRRTAITGRGQDGVWDFLPLRVARQAKQFTSFPHLTMGVKRDGAVAAVTVPNGVKGGFRTKLKRAGQAGFRSLVQQLEVNLRAVTQMSRATKPMLYAAQRHYKSQRSAAELDARLDVDLRTFVSGGADGVRHQPEWIEGVYELLTRKRSNIQFGVDVKLSYACPIVRSAQAIDLFAATWIALSPLVEFVLDKD